MLSALLLATMASSSAQERTLSFEEFLLRRRKGERGLSLAMVTQEEKVELSYMKVTDEEAKLLAEHLRTYHGLRVLWIRNSLFVRESLTGVGAAALAHLFLF